ncbi:MAG: helix-turn-helix domain-containing protein [Armatimonadota bacterium]
MNLIEAIRENNLNLLQTARRSGICRSTLFNLLTGRTMPHPETARRLAKTLNRPLEFSEVAEGAIYEIRVCPN